MLSPVRRILVAASALSLLVAPAFAGQVRVDVGASGGFSFSPATVTLNQGDQVVWVWVQSGHSVTSGDPVVCDPAGDGNFATNVMSRTSSNFPAFSWKSNITSAGLVYFCAPHCPDMQATLVINASGVAVSDFRITEVQFSAAGGLDLIEITNFGAAAGNLGRYRFAAGGDTATVPLENFVVPSLGRVVVHVNASGTQAAANLYLPTLADLPSTGSLGLYAPNTNSGQTALTNVTQIIDFVEWGAPTQANESIAQAASLWTAGQFVGFGGSATRSIEFCGTASDRGATHWSEVSTPNFGSNGGCTTPTVRTTWGRIKTIYR